MKRLFVALLCIALLTGCSSKVDPFHKDFVPSFVVEGDVAQRFTLNRDSAMDFQWFPIESDGRKLNGIATADIIAAAEPRGERYRLMLVGADGLASEIDGQDLVGVTIAFSSEYGWECVTLNHPVSSRIKTLARIIVITAENTLDPAAIGLVTADGSRAVTAGQLLVGSYEQNLRFEGKSEINGNYVAVYTPHFRKAVPALITASSSLCVIGRNGEVRYDRGFAEASLEIAGNQLDYVFANGEKLADIAGLIADAPTVTIAEAKADAMHFLNAGERVLLIELDGWGWEISSYLSESQPFLSSLALQKALAAYPPISPVGLATLLTGTLPNVHGIHDRENKAFTPPDLFELAKAAGKTVAYVEGETSLIKTSLSPTLSPDLGGMPGTDDEVYANALAALDHDLLVVHFHGIDDVAASDGPYSGKTAEKLKEVDGYVADLVSKWNGRVMITADHGLHPFEQGGTHGIICAEDMLVPYTITEGGRK